MFWTIDFYCSFTVSVKIYYGHEAKTHENEANASRGRGQNLCGRDRGHKISPRGHIGLEDLTSVHITYSF